MKKILRLFTLILLFTSFTGALAQIPDQVKEVLRKSEKAMEFPNGVELTTKMHVGMGVASMNGEMVICNKGEKKLLTMKMKVMGKEVNVESGFDGEKEWRYRHVDIENRKDTLFITKTTKMEKNDYDMIDFSLDKDYRKAKMKEKGPNYEITFSDPIDKDDPSKTVMKINKETFYIYEISAKSGIVSMRMTVNKIRKGVSDRVFVLDENKFKGAVVVRK